MANWQISALLGNAIMLFGVTADTQDAALRAAVQITGVPAVLDITEIAPVPARELP